MKDRQPGVPKRIGPVLGRVLAKLLWWFLVAYLIVTGLSGCWCGAVLALVCCQDFKDYSILEWFVPGVGGIIGTLVGTPLIVAFFSRQRAFYAAVIAQGIVGGLTGFAIYYKLGRDWVLDPFVWGRPEGWKWQIAWAGALTLGVLAALAAGVSASFLQWIVSAMRRQWPAPAIRA